MAEQVLRARDTDTQNVSDIGEENLDGDLGVRVVDVDVRSISQALVSLIDDGGAETVLEVLKAIETALTPSASGGGIAEQVAVTNFPTNYPDSSANATLTSLLSTLQDSPDTAIAVLQAIRDQLQSDLSVVISSQPILVTGGLTDLELRASPVEITGTVDVSSSIVASGGLTDAELRASPVEITGTVDVSSSIVASGGLTDEELRASPVEVAVDGPVDVSGSTVDVNGPIHVTGDVGVTGPVDVTGSTVDIGSPIDVSGPVSVTGGLTDAELRASPVEITGTVDVSTSIVATGGLTDEELRASPVEVTGDVGVDGPVDVSGSIVDVNGPVYVTGDVGVTGPVDVTGSTVDIGSPVDVNGPVHVTGDVGVTGPVDVTGSTVDVSGPVHVTGSVDVDHADVISKLDEVISAIDAGGAIHAETIGNGVDTLFTINHQLGSEDLVVVTWELFASGSTQVEAAVLTVDENNIEVEFNQPPATDSRRVVVYAGGTSSVIITNFPSDYPDSTSHGYLQNRYGGGKTTEGGVVTSSGDNVVVSVDPGEFIRVYWVFLMTDPDVSSFPLLQIKTGSTVRYATYNAIGHWEIIDGADGEDLIINLAQASTVAWSATYELITV